MRDMTKLPGFLAALSLLLTACSSPEASSNDWPVSVADAGDAGDASDAHVSQKVIPDAGKMSKVASDAGGIWEPDAVATEVLPDAGEDANPEDAGFDAVYVPPTEPPPACPSLPAFSSGYQLCGEMNGCNYGGCVNSALLCGGRGTTYNSPPNQCGATCVSQVLSGPGGGDACQNVPGVPGSSFRWMTPNTACQYVYSGTDATVIRPNGIEGCVVAPEQNGQTYLCCP
jgi:hypothetical protein